jgi:hypothetical protein
MWIILNVFSLFILRAKLYKWIYKYIVARGCNVIWLRRWNYVQTRDKAKMIIQETCKLIQNIDTLTMAFYHLEKKTKQK